jgi:hypothetical protein
MSRQFHSSPFYHPNNIGWAVQIIHLFTFPIGLQYDLLQVLKEE